MPKTVRVHVTFDETKRVLTHRRGAEVQELRPVFLQVFSDVLSSDIAPAQIKFQLYDDQFKDHVELLNEETLVEDIKVLALVSKQAKQASRHSFIEAASQIQHYYMPHFHKKPLSDCDVDWTDIRRTIINHAADGSPAEFTTLAGRSSFSFGGNLFSRPHAIKKDTSYRLWSPVSRQNDGLIERDPITDVVKCSGSFNGGVNTVLTATDETDGNGIFYVSLKFRDNTTQKDYFLTGNGEDQDITAVEDGSSPIGDASVFEPFYYWSYTMFKNKHYKPDLYLGCDNSGNTTLVENVALDYPNPQIIFVLNRYDAPTTSGSVESPLRS